MAYFAKVVIIVYCVVVLVLKCHRSRFNALPFRAETHDGLMTWVQLARSPSLLSLHYHLVLPTRVPFCIHFTFHSRTGAFISRFSFDSLRHAIEQLGH